mmetsp:Transcript_17858/g.38598  ORF Transcript_17858/g.38598 Transcript_17858/m.38598 type:complete len:206 (+) Transcript_17858:214-831(+)
MSTRRRTTGGQRCTWRRPRGTRRLSPFCSTPKRTSSASTGGAPPPSTTPSAAVTWAPSSSSRSEARTRTPARCTTVHCEGWSSAAQLPEVTWTRSRCCSRKALTRTSATTTSELRFILLPLKVDSPSCATWSKRLESSALLKTDGDELRMRRRYARGTRRSPPILTTTTSRPRPPSPLSCARRASGWAQSTRRSCELRICRCICS